jgi:ABC-2 type transport system permease protein
MTSTVTAPIIATPTSRLSAGLRMLGNETGKGLRVMWVHKAPLVLELVGLSTMYWGIQLFIGGGRYVNELLAMTFIGYLAYIASYIALLRMASGLLEEMFTGTLEQSLLSPLRPWVQSIGRLTAALVEALVIAAISAAAYLAIFAGMGVDVSFSWSALVPVAITVADIAGFAMLIGGIALVVNSIGAIVHVIQGIIMFLNGALIPIFAFPAGLELVAKLVPTTLGVDATRRLTTTGETLGDVWADGTLQGALVHAAIMLILGWTVYQAAIGRGLREGRLGA